MRSEQYRPVWPYVAILICLFGLSLTVAPVWERASRQAADPGSGSADVFAAAQPQVAAQAPLAAHLRNLQPDPEDGGPGAKSAPAGSEGVGGASHDPSIELESRFAAEPAEPAGPRMTAGEPIFKPAVEPSEKAADVRPHLGIPEPESRVHEPSLSADRAPRSGESPPVPLGSPNDRLAMRPARLPTVPPVLREERHHELATSAGDQHGWHYPRALAAQLQCLAAEQEAADWAEQALGHLEQIARSENLEPSEREKLFARMRQAADQVDGLVLRTSRPALGTALLRARYALLRRLDLWESVGSLRLAEKADEAPIARSNHDPELARQLSAVASLTGASAEGQAWRQYLMVDALQEALREGRHPSDDDRRELASRILARLTAPKLTSSQRRFLNEEPIVSLDRALRRWSAEPVHPLRLVQRVETYEQSGRTSDARLVAQELNGMLHSRVEAERQLGSHVERHYRNANLRVAVSGTLLNRWLPKQSPIEMQISDVIAGAGVEGCSRTTTDLAVRLLPDPRTARLGLEARGVVSSDTESFTGPVRFYSQGETHYLARKRIELGLRGLRAWPAQADASSDNDLIGLSTGFDGVPLVRSLVQRIALSQHGQMQYRALSEVEEKVAETARRRMDRQADTQLAQAERRIRAKLIAPLERLGLEPTPIDLHTTAERVVMRLRLASREQLGAHTPRPRAPSDSLASVQLHESALNNLLQQLELDGNTFTVPELCEMIGARLGRPLNVSEEDLPDDIRITFAPRDALQVRFEEGRIKLTVAVADLATARAHHRDFQVHVFYRPEANTLQTQLVRDETVQLEGEMNLRAQVVLRGIFSKMFSQNRHPQIISPSQAADPRLAGLQVTQMVIEDGWIGLAVAEGRGQ